MSTYRPAKIFASLTTNLPQHRSPKPRVAVETVEEQPQMKPNYEGIDGSRLESSNEISVSATGELHLPPDRCSVIYILSSKKDQAQDAKNSVSRRLDYLYQTLHNNSVKDSDISTTKILRRIEGFFHFTAEAAVTFMDIPKCQAVSNLLVEKLGDSVHVSPPTFIQTPQRLENLRRQASILAVSNARQKAAEIAKFLQATVGHPLSIHEEACREWEGSSTLVYDPDTALTIQQRQEQGTIHISVKVNARFELKSLATKKNVEKS